MFYRRYIDKFPKQIQVCCSYLSIFSLRAAAIVIKLVYASYVNNDWTLNWTCEAQYYTTKWSEITDNCLWKNKIIVAVLITSAMFTSGARNYEQLPLAHISVYNMYICHCVYKLMTHVMVLWYKTMFGRYSSNKLLWTMTPSSHLWVNNW
jgi:hypothetical protein